jgi:hypothetical protein
MPASTTPTKMQLPAELQDILDSCPKYTIFNSLEELTEAALGGVADNEWFDIAYDVPGKGSVLEVKVCKVRNGILANYVDPYMRRRDPDCMVVGDDRPTDKPTYKKWFGGEFEDLRQETFAWLKTQELVLIPFVAGQKGAGTEAIAVAPANAGFFAFGLALLQGMLTPDQITEDFRPNAVIYVAPPFRHTHFKGKQIVVHNRGQSAGGSNPIHELFSYNLYPGPSAKKGIYGMLLNIGESEGWVTAHCSTVQVVTPYDNIVTFMHEGASGGGKSEMLEHVHRQADGRLLLGTNLVTGDKRYLALPRACELKPVTDDMALCHPGFKGEEGKLTLQDAEQAWFVRVNHITHYGVDPQLEALTIAPPQPLLFLSFQGVPGTTVLLWDHQEDSPGKPCPNPRVVIPRKIVPNIVNGPVTVDVRSMGVRCPPCTKETPTYGIMGMLHILPPALAWLWRLTAPRGHNNPSIVSSEGMASEGVGSYWPFATGRRVDQANLLLRQIQTTTRMRYILCPNQHVGAWQVDFAPQWVAREYLARRGPAKFRSEQLDTARCPLLGYTPKTLMIEGALIPPYLLKTHLQPEIGDEAYDAGSLILTEFFHKQLRKFIEPDLHKLGHQIIDCCLSNGSMDDYMALMPVPVN